MVRKTQRAVAYFRVSTARQGRSGLGLEAQRKTVLDHVAASGLKLDAEYTEVESGKVANRPQLEAALNHCRMTGAILLIARLDRLSRNAAFLLTLRDSGVKFVAVDMPEANTLTVGIMAVVAQADRERISANTKAALAAAKARGKKLGNPHGFGGRVYGPEAATAARVEAANAFAKRVAPTVLALRQSGASLHQIAATLTERGIMTARGGTWTATAVRNVLTRSAAT